jgi:initiation factor 1A
MATHQKKHIKNTNTVKELLLCCKSDGETYGQIISAKGDSRFEVKIIENNIITIAKIRGDLTKGPKKQRINKDDYILLQKDLSTNDEKYYIIHKYSADDVKKLKKSRELATFNNDYDDDEEDDDNPKVFFEGDILSNKLDEIEINDDFIANI